MLNLTKCSICGKKILKVGLYNHIKGKAKGELFKWYFDRKISKKHLDYIAKNSKIEKVKIFKWQM